MALESKIVAALDADATLTALVENRITPVRFEQSAGWPSVEYSVVSGFPVENLAGGSGTRQYQMSFDCRAETYAGAIAVAEAVEAAVLAATTFAAEIGSVNDFPWEQGAEVYRRTVDCTIWGTA